MGEIHSELTTGYINSASNNRSMSSFTISKYLGFSRYCLCLTETAPSTRSILCFPSLGEIPVRSDGDQAKTSEKSKSRLTYDHLSLSSRALAR